MRFLLLDGWSQHGKTAVVGEHSVRHFNARIYLDQLYATHLAADRIVTLHRQGDRAMKVMLADCLTAIREFGADGLVVHQNPFPPEWLVDHTEGLVRVLGCFDDPHKTYSATLPVLWAYHGAYYCSPSYSRTQRFKEVLARFGVAHSHWFPLSSTVPTETLVRAVEASWSSRTPSAVYVGKCYGDKLDKLAQFDRGIGGRLTVHGQGWPLGGLGGYIAPLKGRAFFPKWVRPISDEGRRAAYLESLIGLNMHLGDIEETGNMRMYEAPMHGTLLLCDRAGCDAHAEIFKPDVEALYYGSIDEAVDKCLYYFRHPAEALVIARRGFRRACTDYDPRKTMSDLLDWASGLLPSSIAAARAHAR
jgi:hypothetical protein